MFMLTKAKRLIGRRKNSNKVKGPVYVIRERKREKLQSLDNVIMLFFLYTLSYYYFYYYYYFLFCIWKTVLYFYTVQRWQHMLRRFTMGKTSCSDNDEFTAVYNTLKCIYAHSTPPNYMTNRNFRFVCNRLQRFVPTHR